MVTLSHFDVPNWKTAQMATLWGLSIPIVGMEKEKFDNYQAKHSTVSSDPNLNCHQFGDTVAGFSATILGITTVTASKRSLKKFALPPRPSWANVVRWFRWFRESSTIPTNMDLLRRGRPPSIENQLFSGKWDGLVILSYLQHFMVTLEYFVDLFSLISRI